MLRHIAALILSCALFTQAQTQPPPGLKGQVTDPSGSVVPGALVQVIGPGGQKRQTTGGDGRYSFPSLERGKYQVRFIAKGFTIGDKQGVEITGPVVMNYELTIEANAQVVDVEDEANSVSTEPAQNASTIVIGPNQVDALSDDPDIMQQQLLALAGPGGGPNGGTIYVDGFSGAQLPPKASIQEIRVNSNPYSPENEFPGGAGIQIITKPGTSTLHGGLNINYNKEALNSRSPLLAQSKRPQYKQEFLFGNLSGQLVKNKASWSIFFSRNALTQNAFIYATTLDSAFNPVTLNQTVLTPRGNWNFQPRIDYQINSKHTVSASFFNGHNHVHNLGVGDFGLASRAYSNHGNNNQLQLSDTAILSTRMVSETKFQYFRNLNDNTDANTSPAIVVPGAFTGGGAQVGVSGATTTSLELINSTSWGYKAHTIRWGGRLREGLTTNTASTNFGGTYTFQGGFGPMLDPDNQPIPDTSISLTALEVYRRTLLFQRAGLGDSAIRALGGGVYQFTLNAGQPTLHVRQFDASVFVVDDWRARPNVTFSYGLRYETQTNISDYRDFAPRLAVAWNPKSKGKPSRTVLRAGVGGFYTRIPLTVTQQALRFNGINQQSFLIANPTFFPAIPAVESLAAQNQLMQVVDSRLSAGQIWQTLIGADRQLGKIGRLSVNYTASRGIHIQRARDINAPFNGAFPFGDSQIRMLTEPTGFSRTQQLSITPSINYKKLFIAGFYTLSFGRTDAEGQPADPYNLRAEWSPSTLSDVRHRATVFMSTPLPTKRLAKFSLSAQFSAASGTPYNITTGRDTNGDSILFERPSLARGGGAADCTGPSLRYEPAFGCFNLNPVPGTAIMRNFARGPSQVGLFYASFSRTWTLNPEKETPAGKDAMVTVPGPGGTMIQVPASMVQLGGPSAAKRKYNLTFSVNALNPLNHTTYAPPGGDLSSPFFGVYRATTNPNSFGPGILANTYNRQVTIQLRVNF